MTLEHIGGLLWGAMLMNFVTLQFLRGDIIKLRKVEEEIRDLLKARPLEEGDSKRYFQ